MRLTEELLININNKFISTEIKQSQENCVVSREFNEYLFIQTDSETDTEISECNYFYTKIEHIYIYQLSQPTKFSPFDSQIHIHNTYTYTNTYIYTLTYTYIYTECE